MEGAGVDASTFPDGIVWEFPGKPVCVRLGAGVVSRLGMEVRQGFEALPRRGLETGGLLIGSRAEMGHPVIVQVDDFEAIESEHAAGPSYLLSERDRVLLAARIAAHEARDGGSDIVGFYRSHTRPEFAVDAEDVSLFDTFFKNASDVFLLIKPNGRLSSTGGFIIREGGEVVSRAPYAQFPLAGMAVPKAGREMARPVSQASQERLPAGAIDSQTAIPMVQTTALRRTVERATFWLPAAGLLALAVGLYWGIPGRGPGSIAERPATPDLNVAFAGNSLRLSWNGRISRSADGAVLWIKDGAETRRLELDSKQLNAGSLVYRPRNSDVEFRLETHSPGANMTESVRAIGGPSQAVAVPTAPARVAVASPPIPPEAKTESRDRAADSKYAEAAPEDPRPDGTGTASRQMLRGLVLPREEPAPAAATVTLPDAPAVHAAVAPPPPSSTAFLKTPAPVNRPDVAELPVRVSVEAVPASRRSFPAILRRSPVSDYVPPVALHDPGLVSPAHRSIAGNVRIDVKVYVNAAGKVDYSEMLSEVAESDRDLAALAVFSARRWEFIPARTSEGRVAGEMILHYRFGPRAGESGSGNLTGR